MVRSVVGPTQRQCHRRETTVTECSAVRGGLDGKLPKNRNGLSIDDFGATATCSKRMRLETWRKQERLREGCAVFLYAVAAARAY
jgi:hypothetical protein